MKKKSCLMLAVLLVMLQVIAVFAIVPASAAIAYSQYYGRTYNVYKVSQPIKVDAAAEDTWNNIPWSESFVCVTDSDEQTFDSTFDAKFKAAWYEVPETTKITLYVYVVVSDDTVCTLTDGNGDAFRMDIRHEDYSSYPHYFWTGMKTVANIADDKVDTTVALWYNGKSNAHPYQLDILDERATNGTYTIELARTFDTATARDINAETDELDINFDMFIQNNRSASTGAQRARYSWNGSNNGGAALTNGILTFKNESAANALAGVSVTATAGASIRLDTDEPTKSGIRFATTVAVPEGVTVKKTGTLVIPTATLTYHRITDSNFNKEVLTTKGLVEGTDYYDIENVGNEWVAGQAGTWYGTLFGIQKENFERKISGIGYAVVEVNGVEYTVYAEYNSDVHSRSIKQVAELVIGQYEEGTDEYKLLLGFTQAEAIQQ